MSEDKNQNESANNAETKKQNEDFRDVPASSEKQNPPDIDKKDVQKVGRPGFPFGKSISSHRTHQQYQCQGNDRHDQGVSEIQVKTTGIPCRDITVKREILWKAERILEDFLLWFERIDEECPKWEQYDHRPGSQENVCKKLVELRLAHDILS